MPPHSKILKILDYENDQYFEKILKFLFWKIHYKIAFNAFLIKNWNLKNIGKIKNFKIFNCKTNNLIQNFYQEKTTKISFLMSSAI